MDRFSSVPNFAGYEALEKRTQHRAISGIFLFFLSGF
jgi:hypothetical protein